MRPLERQLLGKVNSLNSDHSLEAGKIMHVLFSLSLN